MLRSDGIAKVLDFGLAKLTEPESGEPGAPTFLTAQLTTKQGMLMGTAHYMSPEQARGLRVDTRTDIWALGVVLYEMLASAVPFSGPTNSDVIASILCEQPGPLEALTREPVPAALESIVMKALRKDREERYQTANDLASDLKDVRRSLEFSPRERRVKLSLAAVAVVVLVGGSLLLWSALRTNDAAPSAKNVAFTQITDQSGAELFPSLAPDGKSLVYASHASGKWGIYLQRVGGKNATNLTQGSMADDTQPAFSPDGERIAFRSEREGGGIYVMGATGESARRMSDFGYNPAWSPDGEKIVVATEVINRPLTRPTKSQIWTLAIATGEKRMITAGDALQPAWSPHGYRIAYWTRPDISGQGEDIWTIPAEGGEARKVTSGAGTNWNPVWSPDGRYLYFCSNRGGSMNIWRVALDEKSGAVRGMPEAVTAIGASTEAQHLSFSRDGRHLAYVALQETRNLKKIGFDPSRARAVGDPIAITRGSAQLWFPDVSPDGEWLAGYSLGNLRHIFIMRTDGSDLRDLTPDNYRYAWPRWSPDGKRIAFSSRRTGDYEIWAINRDGSGLEQMTQSSGGHYSPWSADGLKIAYSIHHPENDAVIFEPGKPWSEQTPVHLAPIEPGVAFEAWSWSPDGHRLAGIRHLFGGIHSGVGLYDLDSRRYDWITDFGDFPVWLNDGRRILFVSQGKIFLLDAKSRKVEPVLTVTDEDVDLGSPALSRDNRTIYFTAVASEADVWLMNWEF